MTRFFSKVELRVALSYAIFGGLWILLSDKLVAVLSVDISTLSRIQTYKGWAFVAASALLIYYLLRYDRRHKQSKEKELNETQTRLRSVLDNAPIVLISVDRKGVFTLSEGAGLERTGLKPGQVVGQSAYDLYGSFPIFLPNGNAISGDDLLNRVYNGETIIAHTELDGVHFENRFAPLLKRDGTVDGLVGVAIDVTQRNQFEEHLRKAEAQYRSLVEQIPPIVYLTSPGQYMGVNYISPRINTLGFTQEEWVADPELWFKQIPPEDQKRVLDEIEQIKQNDAEGIKGNAEAFKLEYRLISRDGMERWFLDEVLNVFDDHGKILFRQGIMLDITEHKRTEEKIAYQANLLANVNDAILASDEKFVLTAWNSAAEHVYGWKAEEVIGKSGTEILQTEFLTISRPEAIQRLMETGEFFAEVKQLRKNLTKIYIEMRATALRDLNGRTTGYITVNRDITERKRADEELRAINARLKKVLEVETVGVMFWDLTTGVMTDANDAFLKLMGYSRREVQAGELTWQQLTPPEYMEASLAEVKKFQESGRVGPYEKEYFRKDGTRQWLVFAGSSLGGNTCVEFCVDISDRKRVEKELQESEKKYRDLVQTAHDLIWAVDSQGNITFMNQASKRIYGYEPDELIGRSFFDFLSPEERNRQLESFPRLLASGEKLFLGIETEVLDRDGNRHTLVANAVGVYDQDGNLVGTMGTSTDITERKKAEEKIQRQLHRLNILRKIDQGIAGSSKLHSLLGIILEEGMTELGIDAGVFLLYHPDKHILKYELGFGMNTDALQFTNLKLGEGYAGQAAQSGKTIFIPNLQKRNTDFLRSPSFSLEGFACYFGVPLITKGEIKGVLEIFHRTPLKPEQEWLDFMETLAGQAAIAIDNTQLWEQSKRHAQELEQRVAERTAELSQVNIELERANRIKDEFLANMSHELRTPLNSILGLSETLLEQVREPLSDHQQKYLRTIESSGRHLLELINDILDLSKIEMGKFDLYPEIVDVSAILQSCIAFVKEQAVRKSITFNYDTAKIPSKVYADPRRLKQILINLLTNAVKFTPEHGTVTLEVRADPEQDSVQLSVIDTGIGIAPANLERLFQPFVQVDSALNRQQEGTGLGLALVRKLTDLHGGSVQVESEVGKGSRFTVNLPMGRDVITQSEIIGVNDMGTHNAQLVQTKEPLPNALPHRIILLAEDNMANILAIGEYLESHDCVVKVAHNGLEAIEMAEATNPDIILMDIQMPVMDGLEAMRHIRAKPHFAATPIIALTALVMPGDRERCLNAGANEYISKPASLKGLLETIKRLDQ